MSVFNISNFKQPKVILPAAELEHAHAEFKIFRENMQIALEFLKTHRPKQHFLSSQKTPLHLIIGADSAGKSSLLTQSGLGLIDANHQAITNPRSTRYCHFWFAEKEIFVDTAGNYTTASSKDVSVNLAWRGLIKLLNSYKKRCPLSGLIIAIDLPALVQDKEKLQPILTNIKQRIYEIAKYAKELPMYVVFTKADLISGFTDFFADLGNEERRQPYGINLQDIVGKLRPMQAFDTKFNMLLKCLNDRLLWRLHLEPQLAKRAAIYNFPLQIESLKNTIAEIINELPSNSQTRLHGIYFTSSLQQGKPVDNLAAPFTANNENAQNNFSQSVQQNNFTQQQPYFIHDLFENILKPPISKKKKISTPFNFRTFFITFGAVALCICLGSLYFYASFAKSRHVLNNLQTSLQQAATDQNSDPLNTTYTLLEKIKKNASYSWWQVFKTSDLNQITTLLGKNYQKALATEFMPELNATLENILNNTNRKNPYVLYGALKTYLMLAKAAPQDADYIQNWFADFWQKNLKKNSAELARKKIYLSAVLKAGLKINPEAGAIANARHTLNNIPLEQLVYAIFSSENTLQTQTFALAQKTAAFNTKNFQVARLYSSAAFNNVIKKIANLTLNFKQNNWVLGSEQQNAAPINSKALSKKVQALYLTNYLNAWSEALGAIKVNAFLNLKDAEGQLQVLAQDDSPLLSLLQMLKDNTGAQSKHKLFNTIVAKQFIALDKVDDKKLQKVLTGAANYFNALTEKQSNTQKAAWQAATKIMQKGKLPAPFENLRKFAVHQPKPLQTWLLQLADNSWQVLLNDSKDYLNTVWQRQIVTKFNHTLRNRYPLQKNAQKSVRLADFTDFFGPQGSMPTFFNTYLKAFVDTKKPYWVFKEVAGQKLNIPQTTLEIFIRASLIEKMFYPHKAQKPTANFTLTPIALGPSVKSFALNIDGQKLFAAHRKMQGAKLTWPGKKSGVSIAFTNLQGKIFQKTFSGTWGWFKLLDRANLQTKGDSQHYELLFDLNANSIKYELVADQAINPFIPDMIDHFNCPDRI